MSDEFALLPRLTVCNGPWRGASFRLRPGLRLIGRESGVDVPLDDPKVSRRHATVELIDGRVLLADTGSTNGTWLNDRRLVGLTELRDGDRIRVGEVELRFFDPGSATTEPVNRIRYPVEAPAVPVGDGSSARGAGPVTGALGASTQPMHRPRRPRRALLLIGGCAVLVGCLALVCLALP